MSGTGTIKIGNDVYEVTLKLVNLNNITGINEPNANGEKANPASQTMGGGKKEKKERKVKAKGTRKLSPYMKFAQKARQDILREEPALKSDIIAVGRKIGERWRALSADEKAKY